MDTRLKFPIEYDNFKLEVSKEELSTIWRVFGCLTLKLEREMGLAESDIDMVDAMYDNIDRVLG